MNKMDPMKLIQDSQTRDFLKSQMGDIVHTGLVGLEEIKSKTRKAASYEVEFPFMDEMGIRKGGPNARQIVLKLDAAVWQVLCNINEHDPKQGVPDPQWQKIFSDEGIATKVISSMVTAAIAALALSLGGPIGAFLTGTLGKSVVDWILKNTVLKALDEAYRNKLEGYCKIVPAA
jgi:hypothetical protein